MPTKQKQTTRQTQKSEQRVSQKVIVQMPPEEKRKKRRARRKEREPKPKMDAYALSRPIAVYTSAQPTDGMLYRQLFATLSQIQATKERLVNQPFALPTAVPSEVTVASSEVPVEVPVPEFVKPKPQMVTQGMQTEIQPKLFTKKYLMNIVNKRIESGYDMPVGMSKTQLSRMKVADLQPLLIDMEWL